MKQPIFILTIFFSGLLGLSKVSANTVKLNDALKSNQVSANIHGNGSSTHYLEPVVLELANNGGTAVSILIENGDMLYRFI